MTPSQSARRIILALALSSTAALPVSAMDLSSAYQNALQYDSELAAARASRNVQGENVELTRAGLMPKVSLSGSASHVDVEADRLADDSYVRNGLQLGLSQPLLAMEDYYAFRSSQSTVESADQNLVAAELELIFRTSDAYFSVLRALDDLGTARKAEDAFRRQWEQAKERFDVGLIAITEVHETKATYDSGKVTRINAQGQLDVSLEALQRITGKFIENIHPLDEKAELSADSLRPLPEIEQITFENNPTIKAAQAQLKAARENMDSKKAAFYPTLDLEASYGWNDFNGPSPQDDETREGVIGLSLTQPIYLGGANFAGSRQSRFQVEQAEQNLLTAQRNVRLQLRSFYRTLQTNSESIQARLQETISNESALEATRAGYDVGTRNIVEVLDAERQYFTSLSNYANARYDFILTRLQLQQTIGQLSMEDIQTLNAQLTAPIRIMSGSEAQEVPELLP